jgi:hypothetical protein
MTISTIELRLPPTFYDSHISRGLLTREVATRRTKRHVYAMLTSEEIDNLLVDAHSHMSGIGYSTWAHQPLVSSARATIQAINKQHQKGQ